MDDGDIIDIHSRLLLYRFFGSALASPKYPMATFAVKNEGFVSLQMAQ